MNFLKSLLDGNYSELIKTIYEDKDLDIQLRDNYINVYYKGGNILRIKQASFEFDKFYFYLPENESEKYPKSYIEKMAKDKLYEISTNTIRPIPTKEVASAIINRLEKQEKDLKGYLQSDVKTYLSKAKKVMDDWFNVWKKEERKDQHYISLSNRSFSGDSDLVVVDLEFAISILHPYNNSKNSKGDKKVCRFDIIAVDRAGQIYVIELKQNPKADGKGNKANVENHTQDFDDTIGNDDQNLFASEVFDLVQMKQQLGIMSKEIIVDQSKKPKFAVAYSGPEADEFNAKYREAGLKVIEVIQNGNNKYLKLG